MQKILVAVACAVGMGLPACGWGHDECRCTCEMVCTLDGETVDSFHHSLAHTLPSCDEEEARVICVDDRSFFPEFCPAGEIDCEDCFCYK